MIHEKIETFLEKADINYLFCLLSELEAYRLLQLPVYVRQKFPEKITVMAMNHVAENEVPDYISELAEAELAAMEQESPFIEEEGGEEEAEETVDDSTKFIEDFADSEGFKEEEDEDEDEEDEDEEDEDEEDEDEDEEDFYDYDNDSEDDDL